MSSEREPIRFTKMHGLGNDYLYLDIRGTTKEELTDWPSLAIAMSDRHFGVGADGIILIADSSKADVRMRIFNADGSESEMCGNGLRALAKWLYDRGQAGREQAVETGAGVLHPVVVQTHEGRATRIRVDMGPPRFTREEIGMAVGNPQDTCLNQVIEVNGETLEMSCASMGNPHAILFGPVWDVRRMAEIGPQIENHQWFPRRINVHSVDVVSLHRLKMRHWERGAGLTLACGTGVAATVAAAVLTGRASRSVTVEVPGGELDALWDEDTNHVFLTGPAVEVMEGVFALK